MLVASVVQLVDIEEMDKRRVDMHMGMEAKTSTNVYIFYLFLSMPFLFHSFTNMPYKALNDTRIDIDML
jgi:hypothetical protein